jgi:MFS family permease
VNLAQRTGSATRGAGRLVGRGWRRLRAATHAGGAGESGLAHLTELQGVSSAADALFTVALAGILFFSPTDPNAAKSRVALYLLVTIAPFAVVSPIVGPVLDRFRHGRRYAIAATLVGRAWLAYLASHAVTQHAVGFTLYPAAFGVLVLSKANSVARSAATPRLLPRQMTLVSANARQSLAGLLTATVAGAIGGGVTHWFGAPWGLRLALVTYLAGGVLALRLPANVDSAAGEQPLDRGAGPRRWRRVLRPGRLVPTVRTALPLQGALRALAGFLTLYLAFLIKTGHLHGMRPGLALTLLVVAAAAGGLVGTAVGTRLSNRSPQSILAIVTVLTTASCIAAAVFFGVVSALVMAFVGNLTQTVGKLALDAIIQRDVDEAVRTSTFARSETVNQLGWVVGGAIGIGLPLGGTWGFGLAAGWLVVALAYTVRSARRRPALPARAHAGSRPPVAPPVVPDSGRVG